MMSPGFAGLPPFGRGQRIGLFGGSFDPPHDGHRAASLIALRRLRLDSVWWLVSPGNPLKDTSALPSVADRIEAARCVAAHPRILVTGVEAALGSRYSRDMVAILLARCPTARFVWLMGADAFAGFHRWRDWRSIADALPIAIIDRPGDTLRALATPAPSALAGARLDEADARLLATTEPPAFVFLHGRRSTLSSTKLRTRDDR